jgi:DNA-binding MarR family transcriptional regulator
VSGELDLNDLDELAAAFVTVSRALVGIAVRSIQAAPVPVTLPQNRLLVFLAAEGPQVIGTIAVQLGVNPSNATRVVDRLQRLELVQRSRSEADGRAVHVSITQAGRRLLDVVTEHREREIAEVLAKLPPERAKTVVTALAAFNEAAHERADKEWATAIW